MIRNYIWLYRQMAKQSKWNLVFVIGIIFGQLAVLYLGAYISKLAVMLVTDQYSLPVAIGVLAGAGIVLSVLRLFWSMSNLLLKNQCLKFRHVLEKQALEKMCGTAYRNLENPEYRANIDRAKELYERWDRDVSECMYNSCFTIQEILTLIISAGIFMTLNPVIIFVMIVTAWMQYHAGTWTMKWVEKHRDSWQPIEQKIWYITNKIREFASAKDMRLYGVDQWLMPKYGKLMRERRTWNKKQVYQDAKVELVMKATSLIQQAVMYGFLIWGVFNRQISADNFVFYIGIAVNFGETLLLVVEDIRMTRDSELSIKDFRKLIDEEDTDIRTKADKYELIDTVPEIRFSHVSFYYPEAEQATLQDINFTINPGEKIALVGLNGAGKTTLVKLLCGMYEPTDGEIKINGRSALDWSRESWYQMFSVIFQDLGVVPATLAENVSANDAPDRDRAAECLKQAGLWNLTEKLPNGMDTYLPKEIFKDGVNLSGGETQKLLLARAIYKDAPVLILDEPTAALDAIAENELYLQYHELTKNRTSIYISHRLSSTRFCDRILMMENGKIIESGSHDQLMKKKGVYYKLYQIQSHYYQNDRMEAFQSEIDPTWEVNGYVSQ